MKKADREIYVALNDLVNSEICFACKFHIGYGSICDGSTYECEHPLKDHYGFPQSDDLLSDCWAYRPVYKVDEFADIVGVILNLGVEEWQTERGKDGKIKVEYIKES
jgi:hypothetical protein